MRVRTLCGGACLACLASVAACTGRTPQPIAGDGTPIAAPPARRDRDLITREELSDPTLRGENVLDVIKTLRPNFLADHGKRSNEDPEGGRVHASVDGAGVMPLDVLKDIRVGAVIEIRYLNDAAAMQKFGGAAHQGPVILVRTQ